MRKLVGAVGIELKATLKARKLLILLNAENAKNSEFAQVRYTPGTRNCFGHKQWATLNPRHFRLIPGLSVVQL